MLPKNHINNKGNRLIKTKFTALKQFSSSGSRHISKMFPNRANQGNLIIIHYFISSKTTLSLAPKLESESKQE
jgi:hypothetical protein